MKRVILGLLLAAMVPNAAIAQGVKKAPVVSAKTRSQLIKRSCSFAKKGYTDGENLNEIYRLVQMNKLPEYQFKQETQDNGSVGSQATGIFDRLYNDLTQQAIEDEARSIFDTAKKKCKF
jgi:hypothetical protein